MPFFIAETRELVYQLLIRHGGRDVSQYVMSFIVLETRNKDDIIKYIRKYGPSIAPYIDTRTVTNMDNLFEQFPRFNADVSGWDTSNLESAIGTFQNCVYFNYPLIHPNGRGWKTSKVKTFNCFLKGAKRYDQPMVFSNGVMLDLSCATDTTAMLKGTAFNRPVIYWPDIVWNTKNIRYADEMLNTENGFGHFIQDIYLNENVRLKFPNLKSEKPLLSSKYFRVRGREVYSSAHIKQWNRMHKELKSRAIVQGDK
jgi:hypothetical protein